MRSLSLRPGNSPATPYGGRVNGLQVIVFSPPCHPCYGALALTPAGLSPAERASLCWTHKSLPSLQCNALTRPRDADSLWRTRQQLYAHADLHSDLEVQIVEAYRLTARSDVVSILRMALLNGSLLQLPPCLVAPDNPSRTRGPNWIAWLMGTAHLAQIRTAKHFAKDVVPKFSPTRPTSNPSHSRSPQIDDRLRVIWNTHTNSRSNTGITATVPQR